MVKPKLVYISNSTEIGTIYKKDELVQLRKFCDENKLILFMDGARLGSALCSTENDLELSDLPRLVDAFYMGERRMEHSLVSLWSFAVILLKKISAII